MLTVILRKEKKNMKKINNLECIVILITGTILFEISTILSSTKIVVKDVPDFYDIKRGFPFSFKGFLLLFLCTYLLLNIVYSFVWIKTD